MRERREGTEGEESAAETLGFRIFGEILKQLVSFSRAKGGNQDR